MTQYQIDLLQEPNQEISVEIGDYSYDIAIRTIKNETYITITRDNEVLFYSKRCCNKMPLLNQRQGNMYFYDNSGNDDPNWQEFNDRFILVYDDEYLIFGDLI